MRSSRCYGENKFFKQCPRYVVVDTSFPCFCWEHLDQEQVRLSELALQGDDYEWEPIGAFMTNNNLFEDFTIPADNRLLEFAEDEQNVHTPEVQMGVNNSIRRLESWAQKLHIKTYRDLASVVIPHAQQDNKIHQAAIEHLRHCYLWSDDTKMFGITYPQLASWVWDRVTTHENSDILIERFFEEVQESAGQCLNGNMSRLMNVFAAIDLEMSPQSDDSLSPDQVQNLIAGVMKNADHIGQALEGIKDVLERARIPESQWNPWIQAAREHFL
jgi:hypothetical protein